MRPFYLIILFFVFLSACSQNSGSDKADNTPDKKIIRQVIPVVEKYIMSQMPDGKRTTTDNGIISIGNEQKRYIIEPSMIHSGLIDDDQTRDAVVSLSVFQGQYQTISEQLIILKTGKYFELAIAVESDMRIISVKDRIITADVPEHSRNTPLFNCPSCWEVVRYRFRLGELEKVE